jgi:hypothetical protein
LKPGKKEDKSSIKEKLQKGLYTTPQGGYGIWSSTPLAQRNLATATLIGKRPDPFGYDDF